MGLLRLRLFAGVALVAPVFATQPPIFIEDMVGRSEVIAVGKVVSMREVARAHQDRHGVWWPQVYAVRVALTRELKSKIRNLVEFKENELTFESSKECFVVSE